MARLLSSLRYGISVADPVTLLGGTVTLVAVALLTCWAPACRAIHIDPVIALKSE